MEKEQAMRFVENNRINLDLYKSVIVTSDSAYYLDSELAPIAEHCKLLGKTYFVVKNDSLNDDSVLENTIEVKKSDKAKKKK